MIQHILVNIVLLQAHRSFADEYADLYLLAGKQWAEDWKIIDRKADFDTPPQSLLGIEDRGRLADQDVCV